MTLREVLRYPDPRLQQRSAPVTAFDEPLSKLVDDLVDTLQASGSAVGLSAPQVGELRQVLVIDRSGAASEPEVFINPRIVHRAGLGLAEESCLSVPDVTVRVWRATRILIRAADRRGAVFERELDGLGAVCVQHEMDHFDGRLLVDRMNWLGRRRFERRLRRAAPAAV